MALTTDIFAIPIIGNFLIYAPLHNLAALVDRRAKQFIRAALQSDGARLAPSVQLIVEKLSSPGTPAPRARTGPLDNPFFLGLIPTRGCNLGCRYCDFAAPKHTSPVMALPLARAAVDTYFKLLRTAGHRQAEVHFFGGEPFYAETVVHFVIEYATLRAAELGLTVRFEAATNGLYNATRCQWIADHFDTIVLSLDGPADIQERQRPTLNGRGTFPIIARNAKILSAGPVELIVRACVTADTVARLPEIGRWISREFHPSTVCFETLTPSSLSAAAGFAPPDPWEFARNFDIAARLLDHVGIEAVLSTADLRLCHASFCPIGKDALIVSPDGAIDACYLLEDEWRQNGLDMRLGHLNGRGLEIDPASLQRVRDLTVHTKPLCVNCLCRYHCAGACHVNHKTTAPPGQFDDICVQTRLVTIANLLKQIGQGALASEWLADREAAEAAVWQSTDRLCSEEMTL